MLLKGVQYSTQIIFLVPDSLPPHLAFTICYCFACFLGDNRSTLYNIHFPQSHSIPVSFGFLMFLLCLRGFFGVNFAANFSEHVETS